MRPAAKSAEGSRGGKVGEGRQASPADQPGQAGVEPAEEGQPLGHGEGEAAKEPSEEAGRKRKTEEKEAEVDQPERSRGKLWGSEEEVHSTGWGTFQDEVEKFVPALDETVKKEDFSINEEIVKGPLQGIRFPPPPLNFLPLKDEVEVTHLGPFLKTIRSERASLVDKKVDLEGSRFYVRLAKVAEGVPSGYVQELQTELQAPFNWVRLVVVTTAPLKRTSCSPTRPEGGGARAKQVESSRGQSQSGSSHAGGV